MLFEALAADGLCIITPDQARLLVQPGPFGAGWRRPRLGQHRDLPQLRGGTFRWDGDVIMCPCVNLVGDPFTLHGTSLASRRKPVLSSLYGAGRTFWGAGIQSAVPRTPCSAR